MCHYMNFPRLQILMGGLLFSIFISCKKEKSDREAIVPEVSVIVPNSLLNDSLLYYTRDLYLWYNQLPQNFSQQSFSTPNTFMEAIRQYSQEPSFGSPVDHWSFAMKQAEWDGVSAGRAGDFGMNISYFQAEDNLRVTSVEKLSPAGRAGVHRGWKILKINGSSHISYSNKDLVNNAVYNSTSTVFTFLKPDNAVVDITLRAGGYQENPLFLDSVYTIGSKKIGYLVFNSFLGDTTEVYKRLGTVFNAFSAQLVKDLVIDLRYNGGGYVSVQEKLANYLVNASANGSVMMKQMFNDKLSKYNETTLFKKTGNFTPDRIVFIVSSNTASASELLINSLRPYVEVKLVGPSNTHGKPVGFFPHPVLDWYIFPVSFRTVNKNGDGNYFGGMIPDHKAVDEIDKDWGDLREASLSAAIRYISGGAFRRSEGAVFVETPLVDEANKAFHARSFKGSIDTRGMK